MDSPRSKNTIKQSNSIFKMALSSNTYNFNKTNKTKPEFVDCAPNTEQGILFALSKYVALQLIALWLPIYPENKHNFARIFIRNPDPKDLSRISARIPINLAVSKPYYKYDVYDINKGEVKNLGALIFLNIILGGKITDKNLLISNDNNSDVYYFVQNHNESFFSEFLYGGMKQNTEDFFSCIKSDDYQMWWDGLLADKDVFRGKIINEIITTAFRVYSTPNQVIDLIISSLLGYKFKFLEFRLHVDKIKQNVLRVLCSLITYAECDYIAKYKIDHGLEIIRNFAKDINSFILNYNSWDIEKEYLNVKLNSYSKDIKVFLAYVSLEMFHLASLIDLPYVFELDSNVGLDDRVLLINCLFCFFDNYWGIVSSFKNIPIWEYINSVARSLIDVPKENVKTNLNVEFGISLFILAARFKFNNLCRFILLQYPYIPQKFINSNNYTKYSFDENIGQTVEGYLEKIDNPEILFLARESLKEFNSKTSISPVNARRPRSRSIFPGDSLDSTFNALGNSINSLYEEISKGLPIDKLLALDQEKTSDENSNVKNNNYYSL